jgi:CrcB protein
MIPLLVAIGALVGAPARYLTDRFVQSRSAAMFPGGTLTVNVVACLVLGAITGAGARLDPHVVALAGTGFCATLSTYSTFSYETMRLAAGGHRVQAGINIAVSVVAGVGAAALGFWLAAR